MKKETRDDYFYWLSAKIARTMLFIKATTWKTFEPGYKWACGLLMHIYNDNRMMLGHYSHRKRITDGFYESITGLKLKPTAILGTSMSGIAPAASLARKMNLPLIFNQKGIFIKYEKVLTNNEEINLVIQRAKELAYESNKPLVIIATGPYGISYGVQYANKYKAGFAYIRPTAKGHGKEQQIEGNIQKDSIAVVITYKSNDEEREQIVNLLPGITLADWCEVDADVQHHGLTSLKGEEVVVIEDLLSTGGSSAYEVYQAREAGAVCNHCMSIFSYGFDVCLNQFRGLEEITGKGVKLETPCQIHPLLYFDELTDEAKRIKFFKPEIIQAMEKEINGFDIRYINEVAKI